MVKKGSIFARIAERWRSGAGVKVDAGRTDSHAEPARATVNRVEGRQGSELPSTGPAGEAKTTRKLSEREEALVVLGGHFQELAMLMRGVHSRLDGQLGRLVETATSLEQLPELSTQQLEALRGLAEHLERQNQLGEQVAQAMGALPEALQNVQAALQRAALSEERTAATVREFQGTMDRIHASMNRMADQGEQQARAAQALAEQREESLRALASGFEQAQKSAVGELRAAADQGLQALRRSQEEQAARLQRAVESGASRNKAVLTALGVIVLGIVVLVVVQFVK